jgi:HNH endonuclease
MTKSRGLMRPAEERFWRVTDKSSDDACWEYFGLQSTNGYGRFKIGKKNIRAHRYSYELHKGPIPDGLVVRHTCDNKLCVNPAHLLVGTQADNMQDMVTRKRGGKSQGSSHAYAKLSESDIPVIRALVDSGKSLSAVSRLYGVGVCAISNIAKRKSWKHIP